MNTTITLSEYLNKTKQFVVPDYQRGYIWGKNRPDEKDSVTHLIQTILNGFNNDSEVFLQGVTVSEQKDETIIIDGQQRTTCLFLLLKYLGYQGGFKIKYAIRAESNDFLQHLNLTDIEEKKEEFQDIYFFKKTLRIIIELLKKEGKIEDRIIKIDHNNLLTYILAKIKFLYINIPDPNQAIKVFAMMNGNKAQMKIEEIIKAEMLRIASLDSTDEIISTKEYYASSWENNMLRSRYAREWDKWLYWWNRKDVQKLFGCSSIMGLLISTYSNKSDIKFEWFKDQFLKNNIAKDAKVVFNDLRRLQKRFEDAFSNPISYNMIGAILRILKNTDKAKFIEYYFEKDNRSNLDTYYKLAFLCMSHSEIVDYINTNNTDVFDDKYSKMVSAISDDYAYLTTTNNDGISCKEMAFRLLLRLNIDLDCNQNQQNETKGRKFDFNIWDGGNRSLEHIYPKSKVWHTSADGACVNGNEEPTVPDGTFICRDSIIHLGAKTTEHSIGNLVLLYKNENSSFSANSFEEKKAMFFDSKNKEIFNSRHLLHTIFIFAKSRWDGRDIAETKDNVINNFKIYYGK